MRKVILWVVLLVGLVVAGLALALVMAGCDGPTPTVSPVVTPTFPPSPLPVQGRVEVVDSSEEEVIELEQIPEIGGFEVVFLVMGIVSLLKTFGVNGKGSLAAALALGVLFNVLALALSAGMFAEQVAACVVLAMRGVGYTLAIPGLYDLLRDDLLPAIGKAVVEDPFHD